MARISLLSPPIMGATAKRFLFLFYTDTFNQFFIGLYPSLLTLRMREKPLLQLTSITRNMLTQSLYHRFLCTYWGH